jgi:hypothetical protein
MAIARGNGHAQALSNQADTAMRIRRLEKRADVILVALALAGTAAGAMLATASSSAGDSLAASDGESQISAMRDSALAATDPFDAEAVANLADASGLQPARGAAARTWQVGGRGVLGYTSAGGSFCFAFSGGAGGCLQPRTLTGERPLDVMTDYGPGTFNVYGLALDGVTAVAVRLGGTSRPAAFAHNAFSFSDAGLGGTAAVEGEAIATMSDGTTRAVPFRIGSMEIAPDRLR